MQVILKEDVVGIGNAGEIVKVSEGFGRNHLLPLRKAIVADAGSVKHLERHKKLIAAEQAARKIVAQELAGKIAAVTLTLAKQTGEEGKLFGSVTSAELSVELGKQGVTVDKKIIHIETPVHQVGEYTASIRLHSEVIAALKFVVVSNQ